MDIKKLFLPEKDKGIFMSGCTKTLSCLSCILILGLIFFGTIWRASKANADNLSVTITTYTPPESCGNGICVGNESCSNCPSDCGACATAAPASGGGGGGGGGIITTPTPSIAPQVIFRGLAYPQSNVTLLKDAQVAGVTKAGADAKFEISLSNITTGVYTFGVWAEDIMGNRSIVHTFTLPLATGAITVISSIFLPPSISIDKTEVKRGEALNILGYSVPQAEIAVIINSNNELLKKITAQSDGAWLYKFDTLEVDYGDHSLRSRAAKDSDISTFSKTLVFKVSEKTIMAESTKKTIKEDLNNDGKVNLIDFSIMAYWYNRPSPPAKADLNGDGKVNLIDFSIMAYYWTG